MKITSKTTLTEIREQLREDGFDPLLAQAVKEAARKGCLIWTAYRLTTTDASRIDERPAAAGETTARCPRCGQLTTGEEQHGVVHHAEESGDGLPHDGGCDHCCCCVRKGG